MNKIILTTSILVVSFYNKMQRLYVKFLRIRDEQKFSKCGKNLVFSPENSDFIYSHIFIGDDVHIGPRACFMSSIANIYIGNKVVFGPNVTIRGVIIFLIYQVSIFMIFLIMTKGQETIPM